MWFRNNQYARHGCFLSTFIWIFRCFSFMKIYLLVFCKVGVYCTSFEMHGASLEIFASIHPWSSSRTFLSWCTPFSLAIFVSLSKCRFFYGNKNSTIIKKPNNLWKQGDGIKINYTPVIVEMDLFHKQKTSQYPWIVQEIKELMYNNTSWVL